MNPRKVTCPRCDGTGEIQLPPSIMERHGSTVICSLEYRVGPCPDCNGTGKVDRSPKVVFE